MKKILMIVMCLVLAAIGIATLTAQQGYWGGLYVNGGNSGGDYISVWANGSTPTANCAAAGPLPSGAPSCVFAVQNNGNLWFAGNNVIYGQSGQSTPSFLRGYGSSLPAPFYLESLNGATGGVMATLFASTTVPGEWCESASVPGGDCVPGTQLVTQSQLVTAAPITTPFISGYSNGHNGVWQANDEPAWGFVMPASQGYSYGHLVIFIVTADSSGSYGWGIYANCSGSVVASTTPQSYPSTGAVTMAFTQGVATFAGGLYCIAPTGNSTVAQWDVESGKPVPYYTANLGTTSGGTPLASIGAQSESWSTQSLPVFVLQP
jgi:hypothetical protein